MNYTQFQNQQCAWQKQMNSFYHPQQGMMNGFPSSLYPVTTQQAAINPSQQQLTSSVTTPTGISSSKRRTRTVFNTQSITYLETEFNHNAYPDYDTRCQYGQLLGVSEDRIQVWFQNKRSRSRGKKLNRGPPKPRVSPITNTQQQSAWLGSAANSPLSSSDNSSMSITPPNSSVRSATPAPPPYKRETITPAPSTYAYNYQHTQQQQPITTQACKRVLDTSNEPARKRHQLDSNATGLDNDLEICDLVMDLSSDTNTTTNSNSSDSLRLSQHATTRQQSGYSSIDSNMSAEDVFTSTIPHKQGQLKPIHHSQYSTPQPAVFQFPAPTSTQSPILTSTAKNSAKRRPSSLRLDSLELPLSTPCPSFFNGLSPLWNVPFSPLYIPSPRLMLSKHMD